MKKSVRLFLSASLLFTCFYGFAQTNGYPNNNNQSPGGPKPATINPALAPAPAPSPPNMPQVTQPGTIQPRRDSVREASPINRARRDTTPTPILRERRAVIRHDSTTPKTLLPDTLR